MVSPPVPGENCLAGSVEDEGGIRVNTLLKRKLSRRSLVQTGAVAAGAVAASGTLRPAVAAPYVTPRRF
jgi:hypothetical protein